MTDERRVPAAAREGNPGRGLVLGVAVGLLLWALMFFAVLMLSGCAKLTPYTAVYHQSDPGQTDDGVDWGCAGMKYRDQLSVAAGYCWDFRGELNVAELRLEYDWRKL